MELTRNDKKKIFLLNYINELITLNRLTQKHVAALFKAKQPRVSDIRRGLYRRFSLEILERYLYILGIELVLEVNNKHRLISKAVRRNIDYNELLNL